MADTKGLAQLVKQADRQLGLFDLPQPATPAPVAPVVLPAPVELPPVQHFYSAPVVAPKPRRPARRDDGPLPGLFRGPAKKARSADHFTVRSVELERPGIYKAYIDHGRDGELRVVVYPNGHMQVFGKDSIQWLQSDLTQKQQDRIMVAVRKAKSKTSPAL